MANTFSNDIDVLGLHRIVVHGTVDDPSNVASVEIFRGNADVGSAHVSADGDWQLKIAPSEGAANFLKAVITDGAGNTSEVDSNFLVVADPPVAIGNLFQLTVVGNSTPVFNIFSSDGTFIIDGFQQIGKNDIDLFTETGQGDSVPFFCFTASQASAPASIVDTITNFHANKASHDFLDFSNGPFSTIAQVLRHTSTVQGSANIHLDQNSTVKLVGVTKAQLSKHHDVFFFG